MSDLGEAISCKPTALEELSTWLLRNPHAGINAIRNEIDRRAIEERQAEWACHDCGRPAPIHVFVPEEYWRMVRPRHDGQGGVLCLYCMCERLTNCGVEEGHLRKAVTYSNGPFSAFGDRKDQSNG